MTFPTAMLGGAGVEITRIGLGTWAIGGADWAFNWGPQDDGDSVRAIRRAVELGASWIDTAPVYGVGHSEEVVALALRGLPEGDRPLVFTKCGRVFRNGDRTPRTDISAASIRRECEGSLQRLGV